MWIRIVSQYQVIECGRIASPRLLTLLWALATVVAPALAAPVFPQHDIRVELVTTSGEIRIHDRVLVSGQMAYRFQLAPWLDLEQLRLNGKRVQARTKGGLFEVALASGDEHSLEFELAGRLPPQRDGSEAASSHGLDGSFLPAWDLWIPHDPSQPLAFRLEMKVPGSLRAAATGRLVAESSGPEHYTIVTEQIRPGEAPSLFIGPYHVAERRQDGVRLRTYFHPGLDDFEDVYFDAAGDYIDRYRGIVGDYPYNDFHMVSAPLPVGLGFPGLTYIDRRIVPLPFMRTRSLAHEVLHNWWGNAVAVDYTTGNWAEGLTTYMADYALERDKGEVAARNMRVKWLRDYAALPAERDLPVRAFRSKQHQAAQVIGYNKVAFIFHMLSREIGAQAFDASIRRFWRDHRFATASWQDLQAAFEQTAKRDLDWFFRQWLDHSGAPRVGLGAHSVSPVGEGYLIRVEVLQPIAGYRFQLPVSLLTEAGLEYRELGIESARTLLEWTTPNKPVSIQFDPDNDLFRRLDMRETPPILRDITLSPKTQTRVVGTGPDFVDIARQLADRLLDTTPVFLAPGQAHDPSLPLLLITGRERLDAKLAAFGIEAPTALPPQAYPASAWATRLANGTPVLVVSADSTAELQALLRPLPHYGGQSYVLFAGGRVQDRGIWQLKRGPLYRDLSEVVPARVKGSGL